MGVLGVQSMARMGGTCSSGSYSLWGLLILMVSITLPGSAAQTQTTQMVGCIRSQPFQKVFSSDLGIIIMLLHAGVVVLA